VNQIALRHMIWIVFPESFFSGLDDTIRLRVENPV
jgi:hypothetical protein